MRLRDFKGFFKKTILTVDSVSQKENGYYTIKFNSDMLDWRPGEHAIFILKDRKVSGRKWHIFSVASTPKEGYVLVGTSMGQPPSGYKQILTALERGDEMFMRGPFGWFVLKDDKSPVVFITGGIGITPVRSLIQSIGTDKSRAVHLVHSAKGKHLFQSDIEAVAKKNKRIDLHFTSDREVTQAIITDLAREYGNKAYYYISGPPKMNAAYRKLLKSKSVKSSRIVIDPFLGY